MNQLYLLFVSLSMASCSVGENKVASCTDNALISDVNVKNDTIWDADSSAFEIGNLSNGKQTGLWRHYYRKDSLKWEERHYLESEIVIQCRYFKNERLYLEENYLSNGTYSISYYENGCVNAMGWIRTIEDHQGEGDGSWLAYDSLGNLLSETIYDYAHDKILYKEYEPLRHLLVKECEYYQEWGEGTLFKNGTWKYYKNGKLDSTVKHNMESTLDKFGD